MGLTVKSGWMGLTLKSGWMGSTLNFGPQLSRSKPASKAQQRLENFCQSLLSGVEVQKTGSWFVVHLESSDAALAANGSIAAVKMMMDFIFICLVLVFVFIC
jgi:hypothetical protein